jgi:nitrate reductase (NAD(P)H)
MDNTQLDESQTHGDLPTPKTDTKSSIPTDSAKAPIPRRVGGDMPPSPPETDRDDNGSSSSAADDDSRKETRSSSSSSITSVSYPLPPPPHPASKVLEQDKKTPDAHVPRDPRLIRLTGIHPFNVEAPLTDLFKEGFLTSPELFYVRNHGAVPEVQDDDVMNWEFSVEGYDGNYALPGSMLTWL